MKKTVIFIVFLAAVLVLSSCITVNINGGGDQTSEAVTTDNQTTEAQTTEEVTSEQTTEEATSADTQVEQTEQERLEEFFKSYEGYWTNKDGKFIYVGKDEGGDYRVSFGVWNAGGPFPAGTAASVEANGKTFKLKIHIDGLPDDPDWYGEGYAPYDYELTMIDITEGSERKATAVYIGETNTDTFYHHTTPENPFLGQ